MDTTELSPPAAPAPGWYPDPDSPDDPGRRRWWDGAAWGHVDVWNGDDWITFGGPGRWSRRWVWLAVVGAAAVLLAGGCGILVLLGVGMDRALTHDLLDARFATTAEPFHEGTGDARTGPYRFEVRDGHYVVTAVAPDDARAVSVGEFARRAYTVDVAATVLTRDEGSWSGLGCLGGDDDDGAGYLMEVGPDGARLWRIGVGEGTLLDEDATAVSGDSPHRLELSCHQSLNPWDQTITGRVDGREVVSASDGDPPSDGYDYAGLTLLPSGAGAGATFDDVAGDVPE